MSRCIIYEAKMEVDLIFSQVIASALVACAMSLPTPDGYDSHAVHHVGNGHHGGGHHGGIHGGHHGGGHIGVYRGGAAHHGGHHGGGYHGGHEHYVWIFLTLN